MCFFRLIKILKLYPTRPNYQGWDFIAIKTTKYAKKGNLLIKNFLITYKL